MASGKISKKITGREYYIEWSSVSDTSTNTSTITCKHYLKNDATYSLRVGGGGECSCVAGNDTQTYTAPAINTNGGETHLLGTTKHTVSHNSDGSKSITITGTYAIQATLSGTYYATLVATGTATLDTIPRKASLSSADNFNDEDNPTITYSNPAGSAVSLSAAIYDSAGSTAYAAYRTITATKTSYTFNLTTAERNALRNAIPNAKSMSVRFYLRTTINGTNYYSYLTKTLSITNANPTISPTIKDTNSITLALTGSEDTIVKYFSNANITIGAAAVKGATLSSQKANCGGKEITTASGTLEAVESGTFTFSATDSRGNTASKTVNKTFIEYIKLTCNFKPTITVDGVATLNVNGNYFSGSFGSSANSLTISYRYKGANSDYGSWVNITTSASGGTYNGSATITIPNFDYKATYTFQVKANDKLTTLDAKTYNITALPVFDWSSEDFNFNVPVNGINLNGLLNALTNRYQLTPTITPGENYTSASGSVYLFGNTMRIYFTASRSSSAAAGNITNETICSFSIPHGGKILNTATVYFPIANNGSVAYLSSASNDTSTNTLTFDIILSSVGIAGSTMTSYFSAPIQIDLNAYV